MYPNFPLNLKAHFFELYMSAYIRNCMLIVALWFLVPKFQIINLTVVYFLLQLQAQSTPRSELTVWCNLIPCTDCMVSMSAPDSIGTSVAQMETNIFSMFLRNHVALACLECLLWNDFRPFLRPKWGQKWGYCTLNFSPIPTPPPSFLKIKLKCESGTTGHWGIEILYLGKCMQHTVVYIMYISG